MSDSSHVFHLLLAARTGQPSHGALDLAAAQPMARAARAALELDPVEVTEDQPAERVLLHPPGAKELARAHQARLRATALLDVPRHMDLERARDWAAQVLPGPPVELMLLGEPEKGVSLATQRALAQRHHVGRLPFARVRELSAYAEKLRQAGANARAPTPTLYVPRLGVAPLEAAYQLGVLRLRDLIRDSGVEVRNLSQTWTRPGELDAALDEAGLILFHLDLGRGGVQAKAVGSPALGDAADWGPGALRRRGPFLPDGVWWLEASYALGVPETSAYLPLLQALELEQPPRAESRLPEAALSHPEGPLAVLGPADLAPLLSPSGDAQVEAIREATWEARGELMLALAEGLPVGQALAALRAELHVVLADLLPELSTAEAEGALGLTWAWVESMTLFGDPGLRLGVTREDEVELSRSASSGLQSAPTPDLDPLVAGSWSLLVPEGQAARARALTPLIERRAAQTGHEVEIIEVPSALADPESWVTLRLPEALTPPPQLLLVGDAEELSFELQVALSRRARVGRLPFTGPQPLQTYARKLLSAEAQSAQHVSPRAAVYCSEGWTGVGRRLAVQLDANRRQAAVAPLTSRHLLRQAGDLQSALSHAEPVILATLTGTTLGPTADARREEQGAPSLGSGRALGAEAFAAPAPRLRDGAWLLGGDHGGGTPAASIYRAHADDLDETQVRRSLSASPEDGRPFVSATAAAALGAAEGPLAILAHVDASFEDSLSPSRMGLPGVETVLTDVMSDLMGGAPAGDAAQRFVEAAEFVRQAGSGGRGAARAIAAQDLDAWILLGDPAARVPGTEGARSAAGGVDVTADPFAQPDVGEASTARPRVTEDPFAQPDVTEDPFALPLPAATTPHEGAITALCFSAQGALASGGEDGRVWLALPGGPARVIDEPDELGGVTQLCFSPGGDALLAAFRDGRARLFELDAVGAPRTLAGDGTSLLAVGFTRGGRDAVTVSSGRRVVVWPERARGVPETRSCPGGLQCAALGGDRLALGTQSGDIAIHDLASPPWDPELLRGVHKRGVNSLKLSESGELLISGGRRDNVALWSLGSGPARLERRYPVPDAARVLLHLTPAGDRFAATLTSAGLLIGERSTEAARALPRDAFGPGVRTMELLPSGGLLLALSDQSLRVWRGEGAPGSTYLEGAEASSLAIARDESLLAVGDGDGQIRVMRLSALRDPSMPPAQAEDRLPLPPPDPTLRTVAELEVPARRVQRAGPWRVAGAEDGWLRAWSEGGEEQLAGRDHGASPVHLLSVSPTSAFVLSASENGRIRLTRVAPERPQALPLQVAGERALVADFISDAVAVTLTRDGRLRLHDLSELDPRIGGIVNTTPLGPRAPARLASLSTSGALAVLSEDGELSLRAAPLASEQAASLGRFPDVTHLSLSRGGHQVALSSAGGALQLISASGAPQRHDLAPLRSLGPAATGFVAVDERGRLIELLQDGRARLHHVVPSDAGGLGPLARAWGLPDGRLVLAPEAGGLALLTPDADALKRWAVDPELLDVCLEPDGSLLCALSDGRVARALPDAVEPERAPSPDWLEPREETLGEDNPGVAPPPRDPPAPPVTPLDPARAPQPEDTPSRPDAAPTPDVARPAPAPIFTPVLLAAAPPPPPEERVLTLRVTPEEVELDFAGQQFRSANRLQALRRHLARSFHDPVAFGRVLRDAVIHDQLPMGLSEAQRRAWADRTTRVGLLQALADAETPLRLELLLDDDASLHEPLWEALMHDGSPLSARDGLPFARRVHPGPPAPTGPEPLRLLAAVCDHPRLAESGPEANALLSRLADIDVPAHLDTLGRGLTRLTDAGVADVRVLNDDREPVTWEALCQALEEGANALHLVAHGVVMEEGGFHLVMAREDGRPPFVSADELEEATGRDLRLLVLASCNSALVSGSGAFNSLGARLARRVPAVIAMQRPLHVESAQLFAQHFYDDLARSGDPALALAETRRVLFRHDQQRHLNNWPVPVLYRSADHGPLFPLEGERMEELGPIPEPTLDPERELAELRRTLRVAAPHLDASRILQAVTQASGHQTPDTPPQDRGALSANARTPLQLTPDALRDYVLSQDPPLEYDRRMYRQLCAALNARKHVVLIGPPGTGKTTLAHYICRFTQAQGMCAGLLPTTATADWSTFDTIGGYVPSGGDRLSFRPGVFLRAISEGRWLVIDELNRAEIDKAIGELFTAIAGQMVELPYQVSGQPVRVRPPASRDLEDWIPQDARPYDYIVHPGWRILATMNVYDRSSLYAMSFAFMRRFAFVEVGVPSQETYEGLIRRWAKGLPEVVVQRMVALIDPSTELMRRRGMGPAILRDMLRYMNQGVGDEAEAEELCAEAFLLYGASQLDGLDLDVARALHHELAGRFAPGPALEDLLERLRELYPAMPRSAWTRPDADDG